MLRCTSFVVIAALLGAAVPADVVPKGPHELPARLDGLWKVSLCITRGHAWIRYESVDTGEVHTIGRYSKGEGGRVDPRTGRQAWPATQEAGLHWDMDLRYEPHVRQGRFLLLSVLVENPMIIRGERNGFGHGLWRVNCVTYARDAWASYTGEYYRLPIIATPDDFRAEVLHRHPEALRHRPDESRTTTLLSDVPGTPSQSSESLQPASGENPGLARGLPRR